MKVILCLGLSVSIFAAVAGTVHTVPGDFESVAAALAAHDVLCVAEKTAEEKKKRCGGRGA